MRLGIDLGTTRTVIAAVDRGRQPLASFDAHGAYRDWIPGVCVERDGLRVYGWDAVAATADAHAVVRSIKRAITGLAPDDVITALPSRPTAMDLVAEFVEHVLAQLRRASSLDIPTGEPLSAAIAVPANATSRQRFMTIEAFRRAGVDVLRVLNEPTAAAVEYAHRNLGPENRRSPKRYVVVYDLGGGTFDASATSLRGRRFELLATEGLGRLGGDDLDEVIAELARTKAGLAAPPLGSPALAQLHDAARAAKESLGPQTRHALVDVSCLDPSAPPVVLETAEILEACEPLVARTLELVDRLLASLPSHGIDPDDPRQLGAVYVVGGGASFTGVLRALRQKLGRKVQLAPTPYAATAIGLAVAIDPDADILVQEATTRHFGVWREAQAGREKVFVPIFAKDALGDGAHVATRRYHPRHAIGHLRFLECSTLDSQGGPGGELTPWREIRFPYDPALRDREDLELAFGADARLLGEEIEEEYRYEATGSVTVRIRNLTRGYDRVYELGRIG